MECKCKQELIDMRNDIEALKMTHGGVVELIDLMQQVTTAHRLFVKCGNGLAWCLKIFGPMAGIWFAYHKWKTGV